MTIALWCVLVAGLLPYVWTIYAKASKPGYDNNNPREFLVNLEGRGQRANWAQMNGFEAFPPFAAAVIIASFLSTVNQTLLDGLALCFIACRVLHGLLYIADKANLRSIVWLAGMACWVATFILSV